MKLLHSLIIFQIITYSASIPAQTEKPGQSDNGLSKLEYINAVPIEHPQPLYPRYLWSNHKEGWVILSYVVSKKGNTEEAMVEDSSGSKAFERAALNMLKGWKYKPAMQNGEPVDQSMREIRVIFRLDESVKSASRQFIWKYGKIKKLIDKKEFEQAKKNLVELQLKEKNNLYEDAWFWLLKYLYLDASGSNDNDEKTTSLRRAVGYDVIYLPTDLFVYAVQELYKLQVKELDFNAAINTFNKLNYVKPGSRTDYYKQAYKVMAAHVEKLYKLINGKQILALNARIEGNGYWVHNLIRRSFSIGKIIGELADVEIRCDASYLKKLRNTAMERKFTASEVSTWNVPESWKHCGLYVKGEIGTTFTLYEYPNATNKVTSADRK